MFDQKDLSLLQEDRKSAGGQAVPLALEAKGRSMRCSGVTAPARARSCSLRWDSCGRLRGLSAFWAATRSATAPGSVSGSDTFRKGSRSTTG